MSYDVTNHPDWLAIANQFMEDEMYEGTETALENAYDYLCGRGDRKLLDLSRMEVEQMPPLTREMFEDIAKDIAWMFNSVAEYVMKPQ